MVEIYGLCDPVTGEIRYVGKANDAMKRLKSHIRDSRRRNTPVLAWIRKLASQGQTPEMIILETVPAVAWKETEKRLIAKHRETGRLLNLADGGDEPYCSTETRAANGRAVAKALHADPARRKWWNLIRSVSCDLASFKKKHSYTTLDSHKKTVLNCMAMADLWPDKVPASWLSLRWDTEDLGELNLDIISRYMSPGLFNRLDFTGVYQ